MQEDLSGRHAAGERVYVPLVVKTTQAPGLFGDQGRPSR